MLRCDIYGNQVAWLYCSIDADFFLVMLDRWVTFLLNNCAAGCSVTFCILVNKLQVGTKITHFL